MRGRLRRKDSPQLKIFDGLGLTGVPTVILEGRVIHPQSRSVGCLSYFIEQELQAKGVVAEPETEGEEADTSLVQEGS